MAKQEWVFVWKDTETGKQFTKTYTNEREAVNAWGSAELYVNTEPVSMTPEIDRSKYRR